MASFRVQGGTTLKGDIHPQGAKNEALQIISAVLLTKEKVIIHKIPNIVDVNKLIDLLVQLGVRVEKLSAESYSFQADAVDIDFLDSEKYTSLAASLRGSIMIMGPLLARFKKGKIPQPGGDKIGRRRYAFFRLSKAWREIQLRQKNELLQHRCITPTRRIYAP